MMSDKKEESKGETRLIITLPVEMHEHLQRVAHDMTEETFGAVKWSLAMVVRTACAEYIRKHLQKVEKEKELNQES